MHEHGHLTKMAMFMHSFKILQNIYVKYGFTCTKHSDLNFTVSKFHLNPIYGLGSMASQRLLILQCNVYYTVE